MRTTIVAAAAMCGVAVAFLWPGSALAEKVLSDKGREKEATDVVVGRVSGVWTKDVETELYGKGTIEHRFLVEVQVEKVEKGTLREKDVLYARAWRLARYPEGVESGVGPGGHQNIPGVGDRVRVYAVRGPYPDTDQTDNGYSAVYPTGFVKLAEGK